MSLLGTIGKIGLGVAGSASGLGLLAAVPQIVKGVSGIFQNAKGRKLAKNNPFQTEELNQGYLQNVAEAESMAREGMPSQQYNNQMQSIAKNQAGGVRLLTRGANPTAGVSSLVRAGNEATGQLISQDAVTRMQNRRIAMQQRGVLAGEQSRLFDVNKRQKFQQQAQAAAELMRTGSANTFGALDNLSAIGMSSFGGGQSAGFGGIFGNGMNKYVKGQMNQSLLTGYGMNPYTPNS